MPKMVCVECQAELKVEKSGVSVIEMFLDPPQPYKIWSADLWQCPKCNREVIAGFGEYPIAEYFQCEFHDVLARVKQGIFFYDYER